MVRTLCCEKMGLNKGPWTPEEDHVLITFIKQNGHPNWRALPKQAGLLRCCKSCRLRWVNYLRPDIKRGNFTQHELDTILYLHQKLGNRWSAIAAKLPGRTDNEIKNVWHTRLKRRLPKNHHPTQSKPEIIDDHISSGVLNESFLSEATSTENSDVSLGSSSATTGKIKDLQVQSPSLRELKHGFNIDDDMDFWYNLFVKAGGLPELPEF